MKAGETTRRNPRGTNKIIASKDRSDVPAISSVGWPRGSRIYSTHNASRGGQFARCPSFIFSQIYIRYKTIQKESIKSLHLVKSIFHFKTPFFRYYLLQFLCVLRVLSWPKKSPLLFAHLTWTRIN